MLTDTAEALQNKVETLRKKRQRAQRRREYEASRGTLKDTRESLQELVERHVLFAYNGIPCKHNDADISKTRDKLQAVRNHFKDSPEWIIEEDLRTGFLEWIDEHEEDLRRSLAEAWGEYYQEKVTNISQDLLDALDKIGRFENSVDEIRSLKSSLEEWRRSAPSTQPDLDAFEEKAEELETTWEEISRDLSGDIKVFLRATVSGGAPLELVTDNVREWLKKHDLHGQATVHL